MSALLRFSQDVEALLVARNLRGMQNLKTALEPGYCLRAAQALIGAKRAIIGTGFPVAGTFETDGPVGALALYAVLEHIGCECHLACAPPLAGALAADFRVLELSAFDPAAGRIEAEGVLAELSPDVVISIERPGLSEDGRYYNMRGEDISEACAVFDYYLTLATCPTLAIGDGGNEIGMGRIAEAVATLNITAAATTCDELIVADVSNWGAYGVIACLEAQVQEKLLGTIDHLGILTYFSERGSVDGVTRDNTLTEDGLPADAGLLLLEQLTQMLTDWKARAGKKAL